jgi:hypothetical protein
MNCVTKGKKPINYHWVMFVSIDLQIEIIKNVGGNVTFGRHIVEWISRCNDSKSHKLGKKKLRVYGLVDLKLIKLHLLPRKISHNCTSERNWKSHSWERSVCFFALEICQTFNTINPLRFVSIVRDNNADLFWDVAFIQNTRKYLLLK